MEVFNIYGSVKIDINIDIEAETEEKAIEIAQQQIIDEFALYNEDIKFTLYSVIIDESDGK